MEKEVKSSEADLRIDCILHLEKGVILIDFKRTSFSIPIKEQIAELRKIQLPFYWYHYNNLKEKEVLGIGYVCLEDSDKSQIYFNGKDIEKIKIKKLNDFEDGFLEKYCEFEKEQKEKIEKDTEFNPKPIDKKICMYCEVKNICPRA